MTVPDLNVLIFAYDERSPWHARAKAWLETAFNGDDTIGLAWIVIIGFVRLTTRPGALRNPLDLAQATAIIDYWLSFPQVTPVAPGEGHWRILRSLLQSAGVAGNLTNDAHLAALAIENGAILASFDYDFQRFPGIRLVVPGEP